MVARPEALVQERFLVRCARSCVRHVSRVSVSRGFPMDPAVATGAPGAASNVFRDGLGERRRATDSTGTEVVERLCLRSDLTKLPAFEFALRERASRLAPFRHP